MSRTARARAGKASTKVRVDLSNISKAFEPSQEYAVRVTECTLEEGTKAPYFNLKLSGIEGGEFENSVMYHRASTGEASLWRLRPLLEAFGFDIPDGPLDLEASDFVGREAMCSTFLDRYEGGSSIKPDDFWPLEGSDAEGGAESTDFDLDELSDEDVESLAEELGVKGRNVRAKRKALAEMDSDDLAEAWAELSDKGDAEEGGEAGEFDLDEVTDDEAVALAAHMGLKAGTVRRARGALGREDLDEVTEAWEEMNSKGKKEPAGKASGKSSGKSDKKKVSEDDIQEMSEEELEAVIEDFELDIDLSDHKTLRKMKNAVIDAMEEAGNF